MASSVKIDSVEEKLSLPETVQLSVYLVCVVQMVHSCVLLVHVYLTVVIICVCYRHSSSIYARSYIITRGCSYKQYVHYATDIHLYVYFCYILYPPFS